MDLIVCHSLLARSSFCGLLVLPLAEPSLLGISVFQYYSNNVTLQTPASETAFPWRDIQVRWLVVSQSFRDLMRIDRY